MDLVNLINEYIALSEEESPDTSRLKELEMEIGWCLEEEPLIAIGGRDEKGSAWIEVSGTKDGSVALCLYTSSKEVGASKKYITVFYREILRLLKGEPRIERIIIDPHGLNVELERDLYIGDRVIGRLKKRH